MRPFCAHSAIMTKCSDPTERMKMTEISKLKKENKQLRALLSDAVDLLKQSKKLLKQPKNKAEAKKTKKKR